MRHRAEKHIACQIGTFGLAVLGGRLRGICGLLSIGLGALLLGYSLGRSVLADETSDGDEPTPESAELGTRKARPP
ncbi:hypothetical protein ACFPL7_03460 [Dongia soli]|uniref:DUF2892 domain-containing protein n=1 Tax=Dongia soli TaxID=600628 RepID=A0ABU5EEP0_9PROT|nr:hypothetical protein [Dongia soli]MDY0884652.1 hypothetical protein [Dongia soli]